MILVEGLDNTGKTTLVADLAARYPQLKMRPSIGNNHDRKQIREAAYEESYKDNPLMLADRSRIISEWVYGPILKKRELAYTYDVWMRYLTLWSMKTHYVVFCWRHMDNIVASLDEREQLPGVANNLEALADRYTQMMNTVDLLFELTGSSIGVMHYNFEIDHPDLVYTEVEQYLKTVTKGKR